jgi:hypothetical protein
MLSLFPQILFLSPFAALLIRLSLTILMTLAAWKHLNRPDGISRAWSVLEIAAATGLCIGIWTQGVALLSFIGVATGIAVPRLRAYPLSTTLLSLVMLATLVVTGAGALAFDLPL